MKRNLNEFSNQKFDLIIIGGGIFGLSAVWEAAHRGLKVALIEKGDFSQATSANHYKMVHGGIRYLQHADIYRIRESLRERTAFLKIAPHLVQPLPIVIPTYGHGIKGKEVLRIGMWIYDFCTLDRNKGISDEKRHIPPGRLITREEVLQMFPDLETDGLTGAGVFSDAQMYNPPRLGISFLHSAIEAGAVAANYTEAIGFIQKGNKITGVKVKDVLNGDEFTIQTEFVLNTAGPWAADLLENTLGVKIQPKPAFSRDLAFVIDRKPQVNYALATTLKTKDVDAIFDRGGRHVFIVPWLDRDIMMVGVWHLVWGDEPDKVYANEKELQSFIDETNEAYTGLNLSLDDIRWVNTGLTLFKENKPGSTRMSFGKRSKIVDHLKEHSVDGIMTLIGVRATIGRGEAEIIMPKIAKRINKKISRSKSRFLPIYGGEIENFEELVASVKSNPPYSIPDEVVKPILHNYGSRHNEVLNYIKENPTFAEKIGNFNVLKAQVIHAIRDEMAQKLTDVLLRRTDIGTKGYPGKSAIRLTAEVMANEMNWSVSKMEEEITFAEETFKNKGSYKDYKDSNVESSHK